jgi:hypothetical protein
VYRSSVPGPSVVNDQPSLSDLATDRPSSAAKVANWD